MSDIPESRNVRVIREFREHAGIVGGEFKASHLVILHTTGAKTGQERLTPLEYLTHDDHIYVFAAGPGLPNHPAWYRNLVANPAVAVEIGSDTIEATAKVLNRDARLPIWEKFVTRIPALPRWQLDARREFPVIELRRRSGS